MDEPPNPLDPNTPTGRVPADGAGATEQSVHQTDSSPDVTQESPGGPSVVPGASGTGPTSPTAFGRYAVRRSLGAGGFGEVYLGHDTLLDRPVAIKVLRSGSTPLLTDEAAALQEARTLAHLRHPGIVTIHDVGVHAGQMYVVSDYLEGPDLSRWLRDNRPPWPEAVRIVAAVCHLSRLVRGQQRGSTEGVPASPFPSSEPDEGRVLARFHGLAADLTKWTSLDPKVTRGADLTATLDSRVASRLCGLNKLSFTIPSLKALGAGIQDETRRAARLGGLQCKALQASAYPLGGKANEKTNPFNTAPFSFCLVGSHSRSLSRCFIGHAEGNGYRPE